MGEKTECTPKGKEHLASQAMEHLPQSGIFRRVQHFFQPLKVSAKSRMFLHVGTHVTAPPLIVLFDITHSANVLCAPEVVAVVRHRQVNSP